MEITPRYKLGKQARLKSRKQIERLFKEGKSFSVFPFRITWLRTSDPQPKLQAGFTVGSRQFKKATDRNRVKRLMREAYRLQKNPLEEKMAMKEFGMAVFIIYTGNELPLYELVYKKTGSLVSRLIKIADEDPLADT